MISPICKITNQNVECKSDFPKHGARLQHIGFGYRTCTCMVHKSHPITGIEACGIWGIGGNIKCLSVNFFYWICGFSFMK